MNSVEKRAQLKGAAHNNKNAITSDDGFKTSDGGDGVDDDDDDGDDDVFVEQNKNNRNCTTTIAKIKIKKHYDLHFLHLFFLIF